MFCKKCGKNLNPGEIFCTNCGTQVEVQNEQINQSVESNMNQNNQIQTPVSNEQQINETKLTNQQTQSVTNNSSNNNKNNKLLILIILIPAIVLIFVGFGLAVLLLIGNYSNNTSNSTTNQSENTNTQNNAESKIEEEKRVGSDEFGYITIPNNWNTFLDASGNNTLQYTYANVYIATLYAVDTTQISAYNYATNIKYKMQSEGVEKLTGATVTLGKYSAYQVYGYYASDNVWLVCWFFEAEDGKTHYISIEGPDPSSEYFNIPKTFSLTK